jgi:hypothetical protein
MATLTTREIKGDFVVTGPDIEPTKFKSRREARAGAPSIIRDRLSRKLALMPRSAPPGSSRHGNWSEPGTERPL